VPSARDHHEGSDRREGECGAVDAELEHP
jgi:hypothetical protein